MSERAHADRGSTLGGWHFQISKLLVGVSIAAIAATGALVVTLAVGLPGRPPGGQGPNGQPGPPPDLDGLAVASVVTGLFVLSWLAVLVVASRDQILQRIRDLENRPAPQADTQRVEELFTELRRNLAADRDEELRTLGERIAALTTEYGEQRETDGYLNGMRVATGDAPREENVRPIRRMPPQR